MYVVRTGLPFLVSFGELSYNLGSRQNTSTMMALTFRISKYTLWCFWGGPHQGSHRVSTQEFNASSCYSACQRKYYLPEIHCAITMWSNEGASCYRHIRSSAFLSARSEI